MDSGAVDCEYPYRGRTPGLVLALTWGATLAALCWAAIDHGPFRGQDGRETVAEGPAAVARWAVVGLCALFAVFVTRWVWIDRVRPRCLALTAQGLIVPRAKWGWFPAEEFVPYNDVTECATMVVGHIGAKPAATRLRLRGPRRRVWINRDQLPDGAFDEVCALVTARVAAARASGRP